MTASRRQLRPGVHVTRRDAGHLQLGVDPPHRLVLSDSPDLRRQLDAVVSGARVTDARLLADLEAADLLITPAPATQGRVVGVAAVGCSGLDPADLGERLDSAGVAHLAADGAGCDLHLLATTAPIDRGRSDDLVASGQPHLLVHGTGRPGVLRVGPFVVPGVTACLRCVDAHESRADPRRALVMAQLAALPGAQIASCDLELALAWAVRDLRNWNRGGQPSTWSASVDVGPGLVPRLTSWTRHPECGCAWDELAW